MDSLMNTEALGSPCRSAEIKDLAAALAKAQGAMEAAEKSGVNPAFKRDGKASTYATLASVWNAVREPLSKNGLSIRQSPRTANGGVEVETELLHESGQYIRDTLWLPCPTMTVHTVGSMITYLRRYTLMSIVGIAPEDDDGTAALEAAKGPGGHASRSIEQAKADITEQTGNGKSTYEVDKQKKAELFVKHAIGTLSLPEQSKDSLNQMWKDNARYIGRLEETYPDLHERLVMAFDKAMDDAAARGA